MPVSKVHSSSGGNNKGSSSSLVEYLGKENNELDKMENETEGMEEKMDFQNRKQDFFNHSRNNIGSLEVQSKIDSNIKKLGKEDAKFFAPTINFSEKELKHLAQKATGRNDIKTVWDMNPSELKEYNKLIKEYTNKVMDNYAKNFNRQEKGLKSGKDLVYFGKVEHQRKYKGTDKEVQESRAKQGKLKPGLQSHVHIIVSRKDQSQRLKLTPTTNEKNTVRKIKDNTYRVGFDRKAFINQNEKDFDKMFNYKRQELEKFENQNILKNGKPKEIEELNKKIEREAIRNKVKENQLEI